MPFKFILVLFFLFLLSFFVFLRVDFLCSKRELYLLLLNVCFRLVSYFKNLLPLFHFQRYSKAPSLEPAFLGPILNYLFKFCYDPLRMFQSFFGFYLPSRDHYKDLGLLLFPLILPFLFILFFSTSIL